jgi:heme exporter protein D
MDSLSGFWAMGGHGQYVWPAFGVAFGILLAVALQSWLLRRGLRRKLAALQDNKRENG